MNYDLKLQEKVVYLFKKDEITDIFELNTSKSVLFVYLTSPFMIFGNLVKGLEHEGIFI